MPTRYEISEDVRRIMARHHRVIQSLIQDRANGEKGFSKRSLLGTSAPDGGVRVGSQHITILRDRVIDQSPCTEAETPEEIAVARAILELAAEIGDGGEGVLADRDPTYFWFDMLEPLRAMLDLPAPALTRKVIFLDIDGVLLRSVDWLQPRNAEALRLQRSSDYADRRRALDVVQFDAVAVDLVNRLARQTAAKIVVSSFWRSAIGANETVRKLIAQGIDRDLFHEHAYCPHEPSEKRKDVDVRSWLHKHRRQPGGGTSAADEGDDISWIVLDDEAGIRGCVLTTPDDGFTVSTYRVALRALGGEDPDFGVEAIPEALWLEVLAVHEGDRVAAARWVEGVPAPSAFRPVSMLDWKRANVMDLMVGMDAKPPALAAGHALRAFRQRLMEDRPDGVGKVAAEELRASMPDEIDRAGTPEPRAVQPFRAADADLLERMLLAAREEAREIDQARGRVREQHDWYAHTLLEAERVRAGGDLMTEPDPVLWQIVRWVFSAQRPRPAIVDEVRAATAEEALKILPAFLPFGDLERTDEDFSFETRQALKAAARAAGDVEAQLAAGAAAARGGRLRVRQSAAVDERMLVLALMRAACRAVERRRSALEQAAGA